MDNGSGFEWLLIHCMMGVLYAWLLTSNPYDKETGLPSPHVRELGKWLWGNAAIGIVAWFFHMNLPRMSGHL